MNTIRLLAISGSLRKQSYNTALIHALSELAPEEILIDRYQELSKLPLYNPDLEDSNIPEIIKLKKKVAQSDGLIIASPEYAHGITGALKNALDWLVSGEEFVYKPITLFNTSPRASHAQAALRDVLSTMSGNIIENASISVPLLGSQLNAAGIVSHPEISQALISSLKSFRSAILEQANH
ncbi:MAG: NADPH-dependent FMN reductase [Arenicella sp.]